MNHASRTPRHVPVLLRRADEILGPALTSGGVLVDATLGLGGHAEHFLREYPTIRLIGLDRDSAALRLAGERLRPFEERITLVHTRYDGIAEALRDAGVPAVRSVRAVLMDLGVSSMQLDESERGFAYSVDAPLDMRMDPTAELTAADVLNTYGHGELARVLKTYGEERFAGRIASAIVRKREQRPFSTSAQLVELLYDAIPAATRRTGGHPAKRTFQALRVEVNRELESLEAALPAALDALEVGGRIVVMSYQSLEDRAVKQVFARRSASRTPIDLPMELPGGGPEFTILTRGAEKASAHEVEDNPRAAPVRMRAAERIQDAVGEAGP
ncbi:16S rRNA (cytosine(1402)-N(4))-methyltransferase RsmH [Nocardia sp. BMG51109]|uniref:16S rRNA (cytosine(1402)-N(4))-methyltransferase RsmH n=1 Tax=Nocardia sp. BMG51109 TaxID=1056816 RepID=UPI000465A8E5|nr:16S rRNA (cytosine(1402)-N(4))-methyltransferase RsmH [Nocardia sp. BMG51109]